MPLNKLPQLDRCCGCVTDLKTAAAIIAVLGIVTTPAVSWAVVRHSYVIRVSCFITTSASRPDILDINLDNILSFGFGVNAGLGPSCLGPRKNSTKIILRTNTEPTITSEYVGIVKYTGWIVLLADFVFLVCSIYFLVMIFRGADKTAAKVFMISASVSMLLSFLYGMLYVSACISVGGSFPVFEFIFSLFDVIIWITWLYFLLIIRAYIRKPSLTSSLDVATRQHIFNMLSSFVTRVTSYLNGY